ncbi:MAG: hypothetical protein AAFY84_11205 [Pseudomonadota bacterium]
MSRKSLKLGAAMLVGTLLLTSCADDETAESAQPTKQSSATVGSAPSLSVLEFGGPNLLFAADSKSGKVFALEISDIPDQTKELQSAPFNLADFGSRLADHFNVSPFDILYHDLAVHPVTKAAFLAVAIRKDGKEKPALVMVMSDGQITEIDVSKLKQSSVDLENPATDNVTFWRDIPASTLAVTDLQYDDNVLYVAGLSTGEFASTLRQIEYPFADQPKTSTIEMFHAAHDQNETRAPIRAMTMVTIDGEKTLVAAYTCTPLVTIPAAELKDGAHVVGKTIAELGYGNTPVEVLPITTYNMERQPENFVLVINREMSANLIKMEDLAAASAAPGITTAFKGLGDTLGIENSHHPLGGVMEAAEQDAQYLLILRRDLDTAEMELISIVKGAYFRLSDFIAEYNFPDYEYGDNQKFTKQFHNMIKPSEGYPEFVIE